MGRFKVINHPCNTSKMSEAVRMYLGCQLVQRRYSLSYLPCLAAISQIMVPSDSGVPDHGYLIQMNSKFKKFALEYANVSESAARWAYDHMVMDGILVPVNLNGIQVKNVCYVPSWVIPGAEWSKIKNVEFTINYKTGEKRSICAEN